MRQHRNVLTKWTCEARWSHWGSEWGMSPGAGFGPVPFVQSWMVGTKWDQNFGRAAAGSPAQGSFPSLGLQLHLVMVHGQDQDQDQNQNHSQPETVPKGSFSPAYLTSLRRRDRKKQHRHRFEPLEEKQNRSLTNKSIHTLWKTIPSSGSGKPSTKLKLDTTSRSQPQSQSIKHLKTNGTTARKTNWKAPKCSFWPL